MLALIVGCMVKNRKKCKKLVSKTNKHGTVADGDSKNKKAEANIDANYPIVEEGV